MRAVINNSHRNLSSYQSHRQLRQARIKRFVRVRPTFFQILCDSHITDCTLCFADLLVGQLSWESKKLSSYFGTVVYLILTHSAYITCFRTSGTPLSHTDYAIQKTFKPLLMKTEKFRKSFVPYTVSYTMISTARANYALLTNCCRRHWTLALGSFNSLLFYCILY